MEEHVTSQTQAHDAAHDASPIDALFDILKKAYLVQDDTNAPPTPVTNYPPKHHLLTTILRELSTLQDLYNAYTQSCSLLTYAHHRLHTVPYKNVSLDQLQFYTIAAIVKSIAIWYNVRHSNESVLKRILKDEIASIDNDTDTTHFLLLRIIHTLDLSIIMSGPSIYESQIQDIINWLLIHPSIHPPSLSATQTTSFTSQLKPPSPSHPQIPLQNQIKVLQQPTLTEFMNHVNSQTPTPILLKSVISDWPALTKWSSPQYLHNHLSHRTIPIEIGSQYTDSSWTQKLVSGNEFFTNYLLPTQPAKTAYCAQHDLFRQIPALLRDFYVPDYCHVLDDDSKPVLKNCWIGPKGTVSPLHTDPHHNLFAQVVGYKYIRLYAPEESERLYPFDSLMRNTSRVDVEKPDLDEFPEFGNARFLEVVVGPGDLLFIPRGWWHFVKSLSLSCSISFWF